MIVVRRATPHDAAAIASLQADLFDQSWPAGDIEGLLAPPVAVAHLAFEGGRPIGFVVGRVVADEAEILTIGVAAPCQGRGIARDLLTAWMSEVRVAGVGNLFLEVADGNQPAIALYTGAGFRVTGRRPGYYHRRDGSLGDALMMMATLDHG
ncbi:MAG: GNAT family N-acetyltransferase [Hyphomicrobiaceae bacterium]